MNDTAILSRLRRGDAYAAIKSELGVSSDRIVRVRRAWLPPRKPGRKTEQRPSIKNTAILGCIAAGFTYREIAAEFGVSIGRVSEVRRRWT